MSRINRRGPGRIMGGLAGGAYDGRTGLAAPPMLEAAPRIAATLWLLVGAANVVVWLGVGVIGGNWDSTWLVCVLVGGGVLVAGVWAVRDRDRRLRASGGRTP